MPSTEKIAWALAGMVAGFSIAVLLANAVLSAVAAALLMRGAAHLLLYKGV